MNRNFLFFIIIFISSPLIAALDFATTGYIALDTNTNYIKQSTFTFCTWVKLPTTQVQREFITCAGVGTVTGLGIGIDDTTSNKLKFYTANNSGTSQNLVSNNAIQINEWHHVAFIYEANTSGTNKWIYFDGNLDTSVATTIQIGYTGATCGLALWRASASQYLNGQLDDVRYYNRKLTVNEIKTLALSRVRYPCTKDNGCMAYWKLDEGLPGVVASTVTNSTIRDSSGNGVHGSPRNIAAPVYRGSWLMQPSENK